jgi:hypothetical protein
VISAESLEKGAHRRPARAVLFYATDDDQAQATVERLIRAAGFDPVKAGGVDAAIRIEMYGDLHEYGGLTESWSTPDRPGQPWRMAPGSRTWLRYQSSQRALGPVR